MKLLKSTFGTTNKTTNKAALEDSLGSSLRLRIRASRFVASPFRNTLIVNHLSVARYPNKNGQVNHSPRPRICITKECEENDWVTGQKGAYLWLSQIRAAFKGNGRRVNIGRG
jgi:hypothetical protein